MKLPCNCVGGKKYCGELKVLDYKDGDFQFEIINGKDGNGRIYLNKESIKKLIKFLWKKHLKKI